MKIFDLVIVGAGPVGLYAGYYAGLRGLSVHLIENLSEVGGQPCHLYPEKYIYDIAGLPKITGRQLTENLLAQLNQVDYQLSLQEEVKKIEQRDHIFKIETQKSEIKSRAVLITTGKGFLVPRKLGLENERVEQEKGRISYAVKNIQDYAGQKVAIFGGGDSAIDWALALEDIASEVHLIHRREEFRAQKKRVTDLENSQVKIHRSYCLLEFMENSLSLQKVKSGDALTLEVDKILVFYGFLIESSALLSDIELNEKQQIKTTKGMRTNISGIYAAGDVSDYEGKVALMSVGFGEAAIAINDISQEIEFDHQLRNGYSSSILE